VPTYTFSIVPQQSASKSTLAWKPILEYLSRETGYAFRLKRESDIPTFERSLSNGVPDFSYMNPYHYTVYHEAPGYHAIVKAMNKRIKGVVVVKKYSPVRELKELNGEQIAFPSPAAFAASILTRSHFQDMAIEIDPVYVDTHDKVYQAVKEGRYVAGGGVVRTLKNASPQVRDDLRILWTTKGFTPHAVAYHNRVPQFVADSVRDALIRLTTDPHGPQILENMKIEGFEAADDREWDDVRALNIDLLK